jgi:hypothetical protein
MDFVIKEAIEIKLHPSTFNKDNNFIINQFLYLVTNMLKQYSDIPI